MKKVLVAYSANNKYSANGKAARKFIIGVSNFASRRELAADRRNGCLRTLLANRPCHGFADFTSRIF